MEFAKASTVLLLTGACKSQIFLSIVMKCNIVSYFGHELYKEYKEEPLRVLVCEKIFQEQQVESIPIVRLISMKFKTKLSGQVSVGGEA